MLVVAQVERQLMLELRILNLILILVLQTGQAENTDIQLTVATLGLRLGQSLQFLVQVFQHHLEHVQILRRRHRLLL